MGQKVKIAEPRIELIQDKMGGEKYSAEFQALVEKLLISGFNGFWAGYNSQKISPQYFEEYVRAIPKSAYKAAKEYFAQMQKSIYETPANN